MSLEESEKMSFHQRLSRIREKIFRNDEPGLSLEGFIDALSGETEITNNKTSNLTPSRHATNQKSSHNDDKVQKDLAEYQELMVNKEDFTEISTLGRGHFAVVKLVTEKHSRNTNKLYAMKKMSKGQMSAEKAKLERSVMSTTKSDWLTQLKFAFQDAQQLYLVMEYCPGGDLRSLLDRNDGKFTEDMTRFYLAELTLAINALHLMGFVHRDIKPENILLDRFGHLKLTDFGSVDIIAPKGKGKRLETRPVGTPNYVSPEILQCLDDKEQEKIDPRKSDYWSMGVVGFEMITGKTPFSDEHSIVNTYSNIMKNNYSGEMEQLNANLKSLLEGLLTDVEKRLCYDQLVRHAFFNTIDWDGLSSSCAPFVPDLKDMFDTSHFDVDRTVRDPQMSSIRSKKYDPVIGFSYAGKHAESMRYSRQFGGEDCSDMVSSLRRQNEDLRLKLSKLEKDHRLSQRNATLQNESSDFQKLCQQESKELRGTIGKLEKLLDIERQERAMTEKKSLELLTDVKKKWQEREEARIEKIQNALKKSESKRAKMEAEMMDANKILMAKEEEIAALQEVKSSLKSKLKECKSKMESFVGKYKDEVQRNQEMQDQSSLLLDSEMKAKDYENGVLMQTVKEYRDNTEKLEDEIEKLKKDVGMLQSVDRDQKETILFLRQEKELIEESHGQDIKKLRSKILETEKNNEVLTSKVRKLEEANESAKLKLESKDEKLNSLEKVLEKLESKIEPIDKLSSSFKDTNEELKQLKDDLSLKKIDVRLLERRNKELEERIKFRVTMAKEEKVEKDKLEAELKLANEKIKPLEMDLEKSNKELDRAQKKIQDMEADGDKLRKTISELRTKENEGKSLKAELEGVQKKLEKMQEQVKESKDLKEAYNTLKGVCLEQEDQSNEYERVLTKLQNNLESVTKTKERFEKELTELSASSSALRIEKNELKSKLIFTETQLKEVREKHHDIETLYKQEESSWKERITKMSSSKNEQSDALVKVKTQLSVLAQNYEQVSDESAALRDQNIQFKEELSQHITSIQSLKESNLQLHRVIEEAMVKIERKNADISKMREELDFLTEEKEKKDNENHIHIDQLKKLIEHLREKNAFLEMNTKGKGSKKRVADSQLSDEFYRTRTPSRTPLKSPPRKMSK